MVMRLAVVALLVLGGCVRWEKDPLAVYSTDPKALEIPALTFAVVPF